METGRITGPLFSISSSIASTGEQDDQSQKLRQCDSGGGHIGQRRGSQSLSRTLLLFFG